LRRRTIVPRHSRRLCAAAGTVPSPFLNGREFVTVTSHAHACTAQTSEGPKANRKQTAHAVAPSLSHTLADCARQPVQPHHRFLSRHSPITVSQWSGPKSAPSSTRVNISAKRRCGRIPKVSKLRLPAPSCHCSELDCTCAPVRIASSRVDPPATFADRALAPSYTKRSRNQRSESCLRHRSSALRHSRRLGCPTRAVKLGRLGTD
jgi:hypothetical protein